jgi:hypothetical protein
MSLIDEALFIGAGAWIGSKLGRKYLGPEGERPMWNGHVNNDPSMPAVVIAQMNHHGKQWWRLYIAAEGDSALVGERWAYAEILALLQSWERYLTDGGTLNAWRMQNELREQEVAWIREHFGHDADGKFTCYPDGTVER